MGSQAGDPIFTIENVIERAVDGHRASFGPNCPPGAFDLSGSFCLFFLFGPTFVHKYNNFDHFPPVDRVNNFDFCAQVQQFRPFSTCRSCQQFRLLCTGTALSTIFHLSIVSTISIFVHRYSTFDHFPLADRVNNFDFCAQV